MKQAVIKNLKKAAQRTKRAIADKENIILLSDADLDGAASLIILEEALNSLGGKIVERYFFNRQQAGYGLNQAALKRFKKYAPGLLFLSDAGIANFEEIDQAKEFGFQVIIIDHHEIIQGKVPAGIVIDPKQPLDNYPFKFLAACGLCFQFAQELLKEKFSPALKKNFLELTALGTIADMMPEESDNKQLIEKGLSSLVETLRPGLAVFRDIFPEEVYNPRRFAQKIISVLHLTDFRGNLTESYILLTQSNFVQAKKMAKELGVKNNQRRDLISQFVLEINQKVSLNQQAIVFEQSKDFPHLFTGNIASKICSQFKKPTFIIAHKPKLSRGSVRAPKGFNSVQALSACAQFLQTYGGHPPAAGFSLENKNIEKFKECLIEHVTHAYE